MVEVDNKPICEYCFKDMPQKIKKNIRKNFLNAMEYEKQLENA